MRTSVAHALPVFHIGSVLPLHRDERQLWPIDGDNYRCLYFVCMQGIISCQPRITSHSIDKYAYDLLHCKDKKFLEE